jgi:hypothetical protein
MKMRKHKSFDSHASMGAHKGGGFMAGAGELHSPGSMPGPAAQKKIRAFSKGEPNPSAQAPGVPSGIKTYNQE